MMMMMMNDDDDDDDDHRYEGINVEVLHADRTQAQRDRIVDQFRIGKIWVLIATDIVVRPRPSVRPSVRPCVRPSTPSVCPSAHPVRASFPVSSCLFCGADALGGIA